MPNKYPLIWILYLFLLSTSASSKNAASTLKIILMAEFEPLDPLFARLLGSQYLLGFTSRPLLHLDGSGEVVSDILEQIPEVNFSTGNNLPQIKRLRLKLKESLFWADGAKLTAEDLVYTLSIAKENARWIPNGKIYAIIEQITIDGKDPSVIELVFSSSEQLSINQLLNFRIIRNPNNSLSKPVRQRTFNPLDKGNYNGPYFVSEFKQGKAISFTKNQYFKGNNSNIDKIEVTLKYHEGIIENDFIQNNFDLLPYPGLKQSFADRLSSLIVFDQKHRNLSTNSDRSVQLLISSKFVPLKNKKIRQALKLSLPNFPNIPSTIEEATKNISSVNNSDFIFGLLQEAGWNLKNKTLTDKNGKRFSLTIAVTETPVSLKLLAERISSNWVQLGIRVNIKTLKRKDFLTKILKGGSNHAVIPLFTWQIGSNYENHRIKEWLDSEFSFLDWKFSNNFNNHVHRSYKPPMIESNILSKYPRSRFLKQLLTNNKGQESVFIQLFSLPKPTIVSEKIKGFVPSNSIPETYHSTTWSLSE